MEDLDEDQVLIARLMQEEEDRLRAEQLQNDYYTGNRPPTAVSRDQPIGTGRSMQPSIPSNDYIPDQPARYERLIPDPRSEVFEEDWAMMDENNPGAGVP